MIKMWKLILISVILLDILPVVLVMLPGFNNNEYIGVDTQHYEEYPNLSTNEEEVTDGGRRNVDPKGSWFQFIKRSEKIQEGRQTQKKRKNRNKRKRLTCPPGPVGPPGPRGPPGPPGALVTKEAMMEEFKELVKKATDKRLSELATEKCPSCSDKTNNTGIPSLEHKEELLTVPRISVGFYLRLRRNVVVSGRTFMELETFSQPFAAGAFQRGDTFNVKNGRFGAPKDGIYQFSANIHMRVKKKGRRVKLKRRDTVTTQICIDSHCQQYASLRHLTGLESNSRIFSVSFNGFLQLRAGQYTSVYIDNASNLNVVVQSGSEFTGILVGV